MAQEKPEYEVNDEFNTMAVKIVGKFPEKFISVDIDKVCCVNITNKTRKEKEGNGERTWNLQAVKMPVAIHCPYSWYVVLYAHDWQEMSEKHKLAHTADILHGLPTGEDNEGKVNSCDTKGFGAMFRSLGIDFLDDPDIPHILNDDDFKWK